MVYDREVLVEIRFQESDPDAEMARRLEALKVKILLEVPIGCFSIVHCQQQLATMEAISLASKNLPFPFLCKCNVRASKAVAAVVLCYGDLCYGALCCAVVVLCCAMVSCVVVLCCVVLLLL